MNFAKDFIHILKCAVDKDNHLSLNKNTFLSMQ